MNISSKSGADKSPDWNGDAELSNGQLKHERSIIGIDALGGAWRKLATSDLLWEPLLFTPWEKYPLLMLLGLERDPMRQRVDVPAILVYMVYQRLKNFVAVHRMKLNDPTKVIEATPRDDGIMLDLLVTLKKKTCIGAKFQAQPEFSVQLFSIKRDFTTSVVRAEDQDSSRMALEMHQCKVKQSRYMASMVLVQPKTFPAL
ncbi:uncharacterized protein PHALS_12392 [Plasmopara halstedii]|uniref:Uncharacterized protein n=1 Tax=Plasmopara halstedii TaxID=4781 RepID=A0A0P1AMD3_PLAHL|nr:uncharacterized protein PHALS_12392 [Plasmopara halstedii]CEG42087.1 hypothetical protein PHALS_12392 [Plasmopara halstedii]|eukprot:XP_024578456.1 hypothetical protein PHALS_12392 [Plasmopara halstedii]